MESKKRFIKGSDEAKAFMKSLRDKKKGNKGGSNTPPPSCDCVPTEKPKLIRNNKKIIVDL